MLVLNAASIHAMSLEHDQDVPEVTFDISALMRAQQERRAQLERLEVDDSKLLGRIGDQGPVLFEAHQVFGHIDSMPDEQARSRCRDSRRDSQCCRGLKTIATGCYSGTRSILSGCCTGLYKIARGLLCGGKDVVVWAASPLTRCCSRRAKACVARLPDAGKACLRGLRDGVCCLPNAGWQSCQAMDGCLRRLSRATKHACVSLCNSTRRCCPHVCAALFRLPAQVREKSCIILRCSKTGTIWLVASVRDLTRILRALGISIKDWWAQPSSINIAQLCRTIGRKFQVMCAILPTRERACEFMCNQIPNSDQVILWTSVGACVFVFVMGKVCYEYFAAV